MDTLKLDEDTPIDAKILSGAVENAQKSVEGRNFRSRKSVLEYDDVMNTQRGIIYQQRQKVLDGEDLRENILSMLREVLESHDAEELRQYEGIFYPKGAVTNEPDVDHLYDLAVQLYERKEQTLSTEFMREAERVVMLWVVDEYWMDHIDAMDDLKQGIGLRAYGQHDPVVAYKEEGFEMFESTIRSIREETVRRAFLAYPKPQQELQRKRVAQETGTDAANNTQVKKVPVRKDKKAGPNDPCPCGSGKKYKKCCMQKDKLAQ
jgi:preprotein translocase subunit SecA